jgi:hypothetical protein
LDSYIAFPCNGLKELDDETSNHRLGRASGKYGTAKCAGERYNINKTQFALATVCNIGT